MLKLSLIPVLHEVSFPQRSDHAKEREPARRRASISIDGRGVRTRDKARGVGVTEKRVRAVCDLKVNARCQNSEGCRGV